MQDRIALEISRRLSNYLEGEATLRNFRDWFAPVSWDIESSNSPQAIELAYEIDGILSEATSAGWSEIAIREELANTIRQFSRKQDELIRSS